MILLLSIYIKRYSGIIKLYYGYLPDTLQPLAPFGKNQNLDTLTGGWEGGWLAGR